MARHSKTNKIAKRLIAENLNLIKDDNLLIIFEESTLELAELISSAAVNLGVNATMILVPLRSQQKMLSQSNLSLPIISAMESADAVITCLNDSSQCMEFRSKIVDQRRNNTAIGHTPGLTLQMLRNSFDYDFDDVTEICKELAFPLALATRMTIKTCDRNGVQHELSVETGGWARLPIISDGKVPRGSWGNLLAGETYIAPIEGTASGSIVINGAIRNLLVEGRRELTLYFDKGNLVDQSSADPNVIKNFLDSTKKIARNKRDRNWSNLAEIGIGANKKIKRLTGKPVIDEKMFGTLHIAIGENTDMGGSVESVIHYDMTTYAPDVFIVPLNSHIENEFLKSGTLVKPSKDWQEHLEDIQVSEDWANSVSFLRKVAKYQEDSELVNKICINPASKTLVFQLGDKKLSHLGRALLDLLQDGGHSRVIWEQLATRIGATVSDTQKVVKFLETHEMIRTSHI